MGPDLGRLPTLGLAVLLSVWQPGYTGTVRGVWRTISGLIVLLLGCSGPSLTPFEARRDAQAHDELCQKYVLKGEYRAALAEACRALELDPSYVGAYNHRGLIHAEMGDHLKAMADWNAALELDPQSGTTYHNRGRHLSLRGELERAVADLTKAIELNPSDGDSYYQRGLARQQRGDNGGAIADFTKAIELNPEKGDAWICRGHARGAKGDFRGDIEDCTQAIRLDPKDADAYRTRGIARWNLDDFRGARADFTQAIDLNPRQAEYYIARACISTSVLCLRLLKGQADDEGWNLDASLNDLDRAIELDPSYDPAIGLRGALLCMKGEFARGMMELTTAIRMNPKRPEHYMIRGAVNRRQGDRNAAARDYEKALESAPPHWEHREFVKNLLGSLSD